MAAQGFRHIGKVVGIEDGGVVNIAIHRAEACEGCHAKGYCISNREQESEGERVMQIVSDIAGRLTIGESVEVAISYRVGAVAVFWAYVMPLVLFIATIAIGVACGVEQGVVALLAFGVAAIYFGVVYLCRRRFERVVSFRIIQINNI